MPEITVGVANSISANFQFDPLDTIQFAKQSNFKLLQIYLNQSLLNDGKVLEKILAESDHFSDIFYHAEGQLNEEFVESVYRKQLYNFLLRSDDPKYIIHFDERANVDKLIRVVDTLSKEPVKICIENYFQLTGKEDAERNLKKFLALFTLSSNFGNAIYPVLDIPRLFHSNLGFTQEESLEWCYQILNFFGNRHIPMLLHLIDTTSTDQPRRDFTTIGQGVIPYDKIFGFIKKTRPKLTGAVLEFEDKINPLQSREFIADFFA